MDEEMDNNILAATKILLQALNEQANVHDEIFCILMHLSPYIGKYLPFDHELPRTDSFSSQVHLHNGSGDGQENQQIMNFMKSITWILANHYVGTITEIFSKSVADRNDDITGLGKPSSLGNKMLQLVSNCIQRIQVLVGEKHAEERFRGVVSRHMDYIRQLRLTYDANLISDFPQTKKDFIQLSLEVEILIEDVVLILSSAKVFKELSLMREFILDTMLEKMSVGLLSVSDSIAHLRNQYIKAKSSHLTDKKVEQFSSAISQDDTFLASSQLTDFSKIIGCFLNLENHLRTSDTLCILEYGSGGKHKKSVLKRPPFNLPDLIQSSQHSSVQRSPSSIRQWSWYEALRDIVPFLSASCGHFLQEVTQAELEVARELYKTSHDFEMTASASSKLSLSCNPLMSIKCINVTLSQIVNLLPFAVLGAQNKHMVKLQSDFLDSVNQSLKNFKLFLTTVIEDVPERVPPDGLVSVLASVSDIVNVLSHCATQMQRDNRLPFHGVLQLYSSLYNQVLETVIQYHKSKICTQVLHDADSHHWTDLRAFSEGERCSYSIELWNNYLVGLADDLRLKLPSHLVRDIMLEVVCDSVSVLSDRYCNCKPSYNRSKQIWQDVYCLLLSYYNIMWLLTSKPAELCPISSSDFYIKPNKKFMKIHAALRDLFLSGLFLSAPLEELYNTVEQYEVDDLGRMKGIQWMSQLNPGFFPYEWDGTINSLSDKVETLVCIKSMKYHKDDLLSTTMHVLVNRGGFFVQQLVSGKIGLKTENICLLQEKLIEILSHTPILPTVLLECVKSTKSYTVSTFSDLSFLNNNYNQDLLPWQSYLKQELQSPIIYALKSFFEFLTSHAWTSLGHAIILELPPEFRSMIPNSQVDDKGALQHIGLSMVLKSLQAMAYIIPTNLIQFFNSVEDLIMSSVESQPLQCNSYFPHFLLHFARSAMLDFKYWSDQMNVDIADNIGDELTHLANLLINVNQFERMINDEYTIAGICISDAITSFKQTLLEISAPKNLIQDSFVKFKPDFNISFYDIIRESVRGLGELLCLNYEHIADQWEISLNMPKESCSSSQGPGLELSIQFDHPAIANSKVDWEGLLMHCFMTLNRQTIRCFIKNRYDMQENAHLNDEEKDWVAFIASNFQKL